MITKRLRTWLIAATLLVLAALMAGCSNGMVFTGASWPGLSHSDSALYVAYGPHVYAINPETGVRLWSYPAEPVRNKTFFAAPAVADDLIIVADYEDTLTALDPATGAERWSFKSSRSRFVGGAVIGEQFVYAGTVDGTMYALDRERGVESWSFSGERDIWSTPLLDGDTLYFTSLDRRLYALNALTGELKWQFPRSGENTDPPIGAMVSTPTLLDGVLIFGSFNNHIYALDLQTQEVKWTYLTTNWVWTSPIYEETTGLLIGGDLDGHVFALDPETGEAVWTFDTNGPVVGAPAIGEMNDQPVVYIASADARVYVLNAEDGSRALAPAAMEAEFTSRFLFFPTGSSMRPIPLYASPVLFGDLLIVGAHQGNHLLYALDRETLLDRWQFDAASS